MFLLLGMMYTKKALRPETDKAVREVVDEAGESFLKKVEALRSRSRVDRWNVLPGFVPVRIFLVRVMPVFRVCT